MRSKLVKEVQRSKGGKTKVNNRENNRTLLLHAIFSSNSSRTPAAGGSESL